MENKICKNCGNEFIVDSKTKRKKFCNSSCSASFNNKKRGKLSDEHKRNISKSLKNVWDNDPKVFNCFGEVHSKKVGKSTKGRYKKTVNSILELSRRTVTKLIKRMNLGCSNCGWNITTCDVHHIGGRKIDDCDNHNNLSLLCPNCHRMVHEGYLKKEEIIPLSEYLPDNWKDFYYG